MRWIYIAVAVPIGIILLIALIGLMLPKSHRATRMAHFKQPSEQIFAAITGSQDWRTGVTREDLPPDGGPRRWREQTRHGVITFEEAASDPPRLYRSRIADKNLPYAGTWTWEITPTADGCTCRITEEGEVFNPIFRFAGRFIIGHTRTIEVYLSDLGRKFAQTVTTEP
jgi:hypothetical protein